MHVCVHVYVYTYVYVCICVYVVYYMCMPVAYMHLFCMGTLRYMWIYVLLVSFICVLDSTLVFRFGKMTSWDVAIICITGLMPVCGLVWEARHAPVLVLERLLKHTNYTLGKLIVENEYVYALLKRSFSAAIMQKLK